MPDSVEMPAPVRTTHGWLRRTSPASRAIALSLLSCETADPVRCGGRSPRAEPIRGLCGPRIDARRHLAGSEPDSVVDLVAGFAYPLPFRVISELLGVPEEDGPGCTRRSAPSSSRGRLSATRGRGRLGTIVASLERLVARHREHPQDDLIGVLVTASDDDDRLTEQELLSSLFQLIVAGHDTTTSLIGNGVVDLLDHPEQLAPAVRGPRSVAGRDRGAHPVRGTRAPRHLPGHHRAHGARRRGDPGRRQVLICLGAANRDPELLEPPRCSTSPAAATAPRVRPRHPLLPGCAARAARGTRRLHRAARPLPRPRLAVPPRAALGPRRRTGTPRPHELPVRLGVPRRPPT